VVPDGDVQQLLVGGALRAAPRAEGQREFGVRLCLLEVAAFLVQDSPCPESVIRVAEGGRKAMTAESTKEK